LRLCGFLIAVRNQPAIDSDLTNNAYGSYPIFRAKLEPVPVPLTSKEFELPGKGTLHPFQAMIIKPDIACSLVMEMEKPKEQQKKAKAK
jgi:hypothetical protein